MWRGTIWYAPHVMECSEVQTVMDNLYRALETA